MDWMSLLNHAKIRDMDGDEIAEVVGIHLVAGKLSITIDMELEDEEEDPDDGAKDDIPEKDASKIEFPKLAAMGKKVGKKTGTDG